MTDKSKKVRVISLKEAADINKNNVAYFTLTDGSVAVIKKEGKGFSQNYNSQKDDFSKYKRNYGNNNNNSNIDYKKEKAQTGKSIYENYKDKNEIRNFGNYKRRNEISQDSNKSSGEKYGGKYLSQKEQISGISPDKGYSYRGQIYGSRNYQEYNKEKSNYGRKYQSQKDQNSNKSQDQSYSYKNQIYIGCNSGQNQKRNINPNSDALQKIQFKRYQNQNNRNNYQEKNKTNLNSYINNNINANIDNNKFHNQIFRTSEISSDKSKSQYIQNQNINTQSYIRMFRNPNNYSKKFKNNNINYKCKIIEAIPVKLCDNYNPKMRNYSHPKPQYVQPYLNPDIIIQEIKLVQINNFGKKSNINFARQYNTNYINQYNSQIKDSFNDFDNLEDYIQQENFRNDPFYTNVELKYSDISFEQNTGLLKNKNRQVRKYESPFNNIEKNNINKNDDSKIRLKRRQNNIINSNNFKDSVK